MPYRAFAWERRSCLKGIGHGAAPTPTVGSSRGGLLELACAVVPWLAWVPALAERLGENSWARASVLLVKKIGQWELSLEANRSTRALPKISQILWIVSRWSVHSSEETLFLDHMSAPWFILPGTCVTFSERRLFWAHTRRSFTSVQSRFETRPPWWFMYDTTDLLSERISTWCTRMSGRKNWQAWHTASISRQFMCRPDFSSDHRPICPPTALPNPCWKCLSWQPSFCVPCLGSCLTLARRVPTTGQGWYTGPSHCYAVASMTPSHGWNPLLQPELEGWCEADPTEAPVKPLP